MQLPKQLYTKYTTFFFLRLSNLFTPLSIDIWSSWRKVRNGKFLFISKKKCFATYFVQKFLTYLGKKKKIFVIQRFKLKRLGTGNFNIFIYFTFLYWNHFHRKIEENIIFLRKEMKSGFFMDKLIEKINFLFLQISFFHIFRSVLVNTRKLTILKKIYYFSFQLNDFICWFFVLFYFCTFC